VPAHTDICLLQTRILSRAYRRVCLWFTAVLAGDANVMAVLQEQNAQYREGEVMDNEKFPKKAARGV
jgi:hypothetical protein